MNRVAMASSPQSRGLERLRLLAHHNPRVVARLGPARLREALAATGASTDGIQRMLPKADAAAIWIENVSRRDCSVLKQQMLSLGGDAAVDRRVLSEKADSSAVLLFAPMARIKQMTTRIAAQPFRATRWIAELVRDVINADETREFELPLAAPSAPLRLGGSTRIMGVLNVTPDSFSDGGRFFGTDKAIEQGVMRQGADIIDVGGESTRPGADRVSPRQQMDRVVPVIRGLAAHRSSAAAAALISIDTRNAEVAAAALDAGADMINDVSALRDDAEMPALAAAAGVPVVLMHMQGTPKNMQLDPHYEDVTAEITRFLRERVLAAAEAGVSPDRIILDPGIGFGKALDHNLEILRCLDELRSLGQPLLLGASRKSLIGAILNLPADRRVFGTAATSALAAACGVHILRVHDVPEAIQACRVAEAIITRRQT